MDLLNPSPEGILTRADGKHQPRLGMAGYSRARRQGPESSPSAAGRARPLTPTSTLTSRDTTFEPQIGDPILGLLNLFAKCLANLVQQLIVASQRIITNPPLTIILTQL